MAYYIYSSESLPNEKMIGRPGYTPDSECIKWGGITLPVIPAKQWTKMQETFNTIRRTDWRDRHGTDIEIHIRRFKGIIDANFARRGVIFLDHEPSATEKEQLEKVSQELNMQWRKECIQNYEDQVREKEVTGHGRTKPTPYEDECYELLALKKPYSVDALQSQRDPGARAATQIAEAIKAALAQTRKEGLDEAVEILTKPSKPEPQHAHK